MVWECTGWSVVEVLVKAGTIGQWIYNAINLSGLTYRK